jgi:hypothetical protein
MCLCISYGSLQAFNSGKRANLFSKSQHFAEVVRFIAAIGLPGLQTSPWHSALRAPSCVRWAFVKNLPTRLSRGYVRAAIPLDGVVIGNARSIEESIWKGTAQPCARSSLDIFLRSVRALWRLLWTCQGLDTFGAVAVACEGNRSAGRHFWWLRSPAGAPVC